MPYIGSREISIECIADLAKDFTLRPEDTDELYLKPNRETYNKDELLNSMETIGQMRPDECDIEEGELRLWWD
jgi:hypothetical protein